jgi:hypothetical protein
MKSIRNATEKIFSKKSKQSKYKKTLTRKELVNQLSEESMASEMVSLSESFTKVTPIFIQYHSYETGETFTGTCVTDIPVRGHDIVHNITGSMKDRSSTACSILDGPYQFGNYMSVINGISAIEGVELTMYGRPLFECAFCKCDTDSVYVTACHAVPPVQLSNKFAVLFENDANGDTKVTYEDILSDEVDMNNISIFNGLRANNSVPQTHFIPGARFWVSTISSTTVGIVASLSDRKGKTRVTGHETVPGVDLKSERKGKTRVTKHKTGSGSSSGTSSDTSTGTSSDTSSSDEDPKDHVDVNFNVGQPVTKTDIESVMNQQRNAAFRNTRFNVCS